MDESKRRFLHEEDIYIMIIIKIEDFITLLSGYMMVSFPKKEAMIKLHSKLRSIALVVHVILWSFVVLTWMRDTIELV